MNEPTIIDKLKEEPTEEKISSPTPTKKESQNLPAAVWLPLLILFVLPIGAFLYFYLSGKIVWVDNKEAENQQEEDQETVEEEKEITWLEYKNPDFPQMTLLYPEGSKFEITGVMNCETCFGAKVTYDDLVVEFVILSGIGGTGWSPTSPYTVIYSKSIPVSETYSYSGLLRLQSADEGNYIFTYTPFTEGYHIPVVSESSTATFPKEDISKYQSIADKMGSSIFNVEPESQYRKGIIYLENRSVLKKLNADDTQTTISKNVLDGSLKLTEDMQYAAFITNTDDTQSNGELHIYDITNEETLGENKLSNIRTNWEISWINSEEISFYSSENKYYVYNVVSDVLRDLSFEEWTGLSVE